MVILNIINKMFDFNREFGVIEFMSFFRKNYLRIKFSQLRDELK